MMWCQRTDLAAEAWRLWRESAAKTSSLRGVRAREGRLGDFPVTEVEILDPAGAEALGKPEGRYVTVDLRPYFADRAGRFSPAAETVAALLTELLPEEGEVFVAGLGNRAMTPDAIGPLTVEHLLVTRHLAQTLPDFRPVSAAAAGVLGTTGLESAEWVEGLARRCGAAAVIAVDALAAREPDRLCASVQLSDAGLVPGSGVGNHRKPLSRETLGVPVVSVGVPTVVEAATLAADLLGGETPPPLAGRGLFVTPREVDARTADLGRLLGTAITMATQQGLSAEDALALVQ